MEEKWTFQTIGIALNEFNLTQADFNDYIEQSGYYHIAFKDPEDSNIKFHVHIYRDLTIDVKVSTEFLLMYCTLISENVWVRVGSQGRLLKKPRRRTVQRAYKTIHPKKESSIAILNSLPMMFYCRESFSNAFHWFAKRVMKSGILITDFTETRYILDYAKNWINTHKEDIPNSLDTFLSSVIGYFHITLTLHDERDKQPSITINRTRYTIIDGVYISPFALDLLTKNNDLVSGLLLDTTWRVISKFVTSILMITACNVGIPIAFAFGASEDKSLYSLFTDKFNETLNINISQCVCATRSMSASFSCKLSGWPVSFSKMSERL